MQFGDKSASPRLMVAVLWATSMFISWAGGTFIIGFDLGTTLIWLALTILGPMLVWAFLAAVEAQALPPQGSRRRDSNP